MRVVIGVMVGFVQFLVRHDLTLDNFLAKDYVEGMWMMLQQEKPDDFVLATGETHPVREFIIKAFEAAGITLRYFNRNYSVFILFSDLHSRWEGSGEEEIAIDVQTNKVVVKVDPRYFRPAEVE